MPFLPKKIWKGLGFFLIVILVLGAIKNQILKTLVTKSAAQVLGAPVKIDSFSLSFLRRKIHIQGIKVLNPPGFPNETLIDVPEILVSNYDLPALLQGKIHLNVVKINLKEAVIIRAKNKKLNVDCLKVVEEAKQNKNAPIEKNVKSKSPPLKIEHLTLNIGRIIFKDLSVVGTPTVQVFEVGIKNKVFLNIKSVEALIAVVLVEAIRPTAIRNAAVYGAASVLGVAFLPAGIAAVLTGKDHAVTVIAMEVDQVYKETFACLKKIGQITSENPGTRTIKLTVDRNSVTVKLTSKAKQTEILVSARKYLLPKPQVAGGVLYQILNALNTQPVTIPSH